MANINFDQGITINLVNAGAVAGTTSTFTSTVTTAGLINAAFVTTLAPQTNAASPVLDWATGLAFNTLLPNQTCALVFGQTAAGVLKLCQGPIIPTVVGVTTTVGAFLVAPQFPGLPDNFLVLAYTIVRTAPSAANWLPGAGSWTASGVSATAFQNIGQLPNRPRIV